MAADSLQGHAEFDNERSLLSRLSHGHLVRLLGVCRSSDPPLRCLIYELMPGGNVEEQLANQVSRKLQEAASGGQLLTCHDQHAQHATHPAVQCSWLDLLS
jgi:serine/threonine protein kinase